MHQVQINDPATEAELLSALQDQSEPVSLTAAQEVLRRILSDDSPITEDSAIAQHARKLLEVDWAKQEPIEIRPDGETIISAYSLLYR